MPRSFKCGAAASLRHALALLATTLRASFALRGAFLISAVSMVINNLLFASMWWILMERFGQIGGYGLADVMCLFGISASGFGLAVVFAGGVVELSRKVEEGQIDVWLTQPKSVLIQALGSRTHVSGWGDLASGAGMLWFSGAVSPQSAPLALIGIGCAFLAFVSAGIMAHSLCFWLGRTQALSRSLFEFTVTFSLYPPALFGARLKVLLFTILPAGFISFLPVELLRRPSWLLGLACVLGTLLHAAAAVFLFTRGLRRHAGGSGLGLRA